VIALAWVAYAIADVRVLVLLVGVGSEVVGVAAGAVGLVRAEPVGHLLMRSAWKRR
jgi:hypothetical protein